MGPETDRIKDHIDTERERLGEQLDEVEGRFRKATDIRSQFEAHPAWAACMAFGVGTMLGGWLSSGSRESDAEPSESRQSRRAEPYTERVGRAMSAASAKAPETTEHLGQVREMVDGVLGALIGVGATSLKNVVSDTVPGFREEYEQIEARRGRGRREEARSSAGGESLS